MTSTADTWILDAMSPLFLERTGYTLKPIAVGSGVALELGERAKPTSSSSTLPPPRRSS
jgi:tungstate transport system substrate-binding protein